jgi:hypothetical protein
MLRDERVWYHRDPVSNIGGETGIVLRCMSKRTHEPYFKVKILSGPRKGQWTWPDYWSLGAGPYKRRCANPECDRSFQTEDRAIDLCPHCQSIEEAEIAARRAPDRTDRYAGVRWKHEERGHGRRHF